MYDNTFSTTRVAMMCLRNYDEMNAVAGRKSRCLVCQKSPYHDGLTCAGAAAAQSVSASAALRYAGFFDAACGGVGFGGLDGVVVVVALTVAVLVVVVAVTVVVVVVAAAAAAVVVVVVMLMLMVIASMAVTTMLFVLLLLVVWWCHLCHHTYRMYYLTFALTATRRNRRLIYVAAM